MSEQIKEREKQIWTVVFIAIPVAILFGFKSAFMEDTEISFLYAGVFGLLGSIVGIAIDFSTRNKARWVKITAAHILFIAGILLLWFYKPASSDEELLKRDWQSQRIGKIEFDLPYKLSLQSDEVPLELQGVYQNLAVYTDAKSDRISSFMQMTLQSDSLAIDKAFYGALDGMLQKMGQKLENTKRKIYHADEEEIALRFAYAADGDSLYGYGFMYHYGYQLESLWLIPQERGFSKDFIESVHWGIIVDY